MAIIFNDNFSLSAPKPIRNTDLVGAGNPYSDYATKEAIPVEMRHPFMITTDENGIMWRLEGGLGNSNWVELDFASGVTEHNLLTGRDATDAHPITSITGLRGELDGKYNKTDFIQISGGGTDAGKPIVLNSQGQIDPSMIDASTFYYVSDFTPTAGDYYTEYPDTTGETHGAFWVVQGLASTYTFTATCPSCDLNGMDIDNGDFMVWGSAGWSIMRGEMNPTLYYKLDGTQQLTADFAGGGFKLTGIADGTDPTDGATFGQITGYTEDYALPLYAKVIESNSDYTTISGDVGALIVMTGGTAVTLDSSGLQVGYQQIIFNTTGSDIGLLSPDYVEGVNELIPDGFFAAYYLVAPATWVITTPTPSGGGGTGDHGSLTGLGDDDHPQYLLADGTRPVVGDFFIDRENATADNPDVVWRDENGETFVTIGAGGNGSGVISVYQGGTIVNQLQVGITDGVALIGGETIWHTGNAAGADIPIRTGDGTSFLANDGSYKPVVQNVDWGDIGGTLSAQTDLQDELDAKSDTGHAHDITDVTGLQDALDDKSDTGHIHAIADVTDLQDDLDGKAPLVHIHGIGDITDLQTSLDGKSPLGHDHNSEYYVQTYFTDTSAGTDDAGRPILLNDQGQVDASMIDVSTFYYVGEFTPATGTEYPDTTGESAGATWLVNGLSAPYDFTGGDLSGQTADNGDYMIWGTVSWGLRKNVGIPDAPVDTNTYGRKDASWVDLGVIYAPISHIHIINDVTGLQDELDGKALLVHTHVIGDTTGLQDELDGKALLAHTHVIGDTTGLQDALDDKSDVGHGHTVSEISDFNTGVSANADVTANTGARHSHSNLTLLESLIDNGSATDFLNAEGNYVPISSGSQTLLGLTDTPSDYTGMAGAHLAVNDAEDGVEFQTDIEMGSVEYNYRWDDDTDTTVAPASGHVKVNNAVYADVTEIAASETDRNGKLRDGAWKAIGFGDVLVFRDANTDKGIVFKVNGDETDNGDWITLSVTWLKDVAPTFNSNEKMIVGMIFLAPKKIIELQDVPDNYGAVGQVLEVNSAGDGMIWADKAGSGATTFVGLTDTPPNYTGKSGYFVKVNAGDGTNGTGLEFVDFMHNNIGGRSAVDAHPIAAISGLQTSLNGKESSLGNPTNDGYVLSSLVDGTRSWIPVSGLSDAPSDGTMYGRLDGAWVDIDSQFVTSTELSSALVDYLPLLGGTMGGDILMGGNSLTGVGGISSGSGNFSGVVTGRDQSSTPPNNNEFITAIHANATYALIGHTHSYDFTDLGDTPDNYTGADGFLVKVKTGGGLEFVQETSVSVDWGDIGGDIALQTDLYDEFSIKTHLHTGTYEPFLDKTAQAGKMIVVNPTNNGWDFQDLPPAGKTIHNQLTGLDADDHLQYLLADGSRDLTGQLKVKHQGTNILVFPITNIVQTESIPHIRTYAYTEEENNGHAQAQLGVMWDGSVTGVDYPTSYLSLEYDNSSGSWIKSIWLNGGRASDGAVSQIGSKLHIGYDKCCPDLTRDEYLVVNGAADFFGAVTGRDQVGATLSPNEFINKDFADASYASKSHNHVGLYEPIIDKTAQAGKMIVVNSTNDGWDFQSVPSGGGFDPAANIAFTGNNTHAGNEFFNGVTKIGKDKMLYFGENTTDDWRMRLFENGTASYIDIMSDSFYVRDAAGGDEILRLDKTTKSAWAGGQELTYSIEDSGTPFKVKGFWTGSQNQYNAISHSADIIYFIDEY